MYGSTTIQSRLFLKNIENFVWFLKQYLLDFFILEKQLANIPDRGFLFLRNTLLLYSLSPYSQTERQTDTYFRKNNMTFSFLLLRITFFYSVDNIHLYSHDWFSKISTTFCVSTNRWIVVVFLEDNSLKITILLQKNETFSNLSVAIISQKYQEFSM